MSVGATQGPFGTLCYVVLQALVYLTGNLDRAGGLVFHPWGEYAAKAARRLRIGSSSVYGRVGGLPGGLANEILTPGPEWIRAIIVLSNRSHCSSLFQQGVPGAGRSWKQRVTAIHLWVCAPCTGTGRAPAQIPGAH